VDQIDNASFPRRGVSAVASGYLSDERVGATDTYRLLRLDGFAPATFARHTLLPFLRVATGLDRSVPLYGRGPLGGLFNLSGYREGRLSGNHTGVAGLVYYLRLLDTAGNFARSLYVGASAEAGGAWEDLEEIHPTDLVGSGSLFVGLDTSLGPLYLAYGLAQDGGWGRIYLYVGQTL
jgi:NTE family protein